MNSEKKQFDILLFDDHPLMRKGFRLLLEQDPLFHVIHDSDFSTYGLDLFTRYRPDLTIMDPLDKSHLALLKDLLAKNPSAKIIVLSTDAKEETIFCSLKAGVRGFLLKKSDWSEARQAILSVLQGDCYLTPHITKNVIQHYIRSKNTNSYEQQFEKLTRREKEILFLVGKRLKNQEIAKQLYISIKTVEKHRSNIMRKLNFSSSADIIKFAQNVVLSCSPSNGMHH